MNDDLNSLHFAATMLSSKWTLPVVYTLKDRTHRYHEIHKHIPTATEKMLTATLRKLEKDGLVKRKIYPTVPPKVEYTLTPLGLEVLAMTQSVSQFVRNNPVIAQAKEAHTGASFLTTTKKLSSRE